jgi:hypothetical protein
MAEKSGQKLPAGSNVFGELGGKEEKYLNEFSIEEIKF